MMSPRGRTLSDSMDYDDELAELHDKRERQLRMASSTSESRFMVGGGDVDTDEDTEDASEDGEGRHSHDRHDEPQEIKEQVYYDKLGLLKTNIEELKSGNHIEFSRKLATIEQEYNERRGMNAAWKDYELQCIERDYSNERLLIVREFEDKKIELRDNLMNELEEKKKQIEMERFSMELTSDPTEVKPMSTRKLRRRPNEPVPIPEKRRKTPQSQITFLLDEKEMEEDLKSIQNFFKRKVYDGGPGNRKSHNSGCLSTSTSERLGYSAETNIPIHCDATIENGKLFYEKKWFHRGQPVFVEGKEFPQISAVISSISQDVVWVRKLNDQTKIRVPIASLQKGKMVIMRRA